MPETAGAARRRCSWSVDQVLGLFDPPTWGWFDRQHLDDGLDNQISSRRGLGEGAGQPHPAQRLLGRPRRD